MSTPLMPKATAVWLIDNTTLTFEQIADFCEMHVLEVHGVADGEVAQGIKGLDPVAAGQLDREDITRCEADSEARLKLKKHEHAPTKRRKGPRYTPVSRRQDRPDAIAWLVRHHPEMSDAQIGKLIGTTKTTIQAVRDRTHWNAANIKFVDPVSLGLCTQIELDEAVRVAAAQRDKAAGAHVPAPEATLVPVAESLAAKETPEASEMTPEEVAEKSAPLDDPDALFNLPRSRKETAEDEI